MAFDIPTDDDADQLRREVAVYPTDLLRRFRLGAALSRRLDYAGAIPELQRAIDNPSVRLAALKLLVEAFEAKRMFNLAARYREQLPEDGGEESGSGSAPTPAPKGPITPIDSLGARKRLDGDDNPS
jgi:hypothetical protein